MKFLANALKDAKGPKTDLIDALKEHFEKPLPERSHKEIHASDLTKEHFCPRAIALMDILKVQRKPQNIAVAMAVTWDAGEMTSDLLREKWLVSRAYGNWRCIKCNRLQEFCKKPSEIDYTSMCKHLWDYEEIRFRDPVHQYSGGIDCIYDLGAEKLTIAEHKIVSQEEFKKLNAPYPEHRLRTNLYMNLVENSDHPHKGRVNTTRAKVLYVSRGYGCKQESGETLPFKEFEVDRNDADLAGPLALALEVVNFRKGGIMPKFTCLFSYSPEAKSCQVNMACWSGKYPPCAVATSDLTSVANVTTLPSSNTTLA